MINASEPSDIIWENRHISARERRRKRLILYLVIVLVLCMSATVVFAVSNVQMRLMRRNPKFNCNEVEEEFMGSS